VQLTGDQLRQPETDVERIVRVGNKSTRRELRSREWSPFASDDGDEWKVGFEFDGQGRLLRLTIEPHGRVAYLAGDQIVGRRDAIESAEVERPISGTGITKRMLRALPFQDLATDAKKRIGGERGIPLRRESTPGGASRLTLDLDRAESAAEWASIFAKRPGRAGRDDHDYAELAREYVDAVKVTRGRPIPYLAKRLYLSESAVRNLVNLLRPKHHNMLTDPPIKGRAGGELTDKANAILEGRD
jgi:hypothetical protein